MPFWSNPFKKRSSSKKEKKKPKKKGQSSSSSSSSAHISETPSSSLDQSNRSRQMAAGLWKGSDTDGVSSLLETAARAASKNDDGDEHKMSSCSSAMKTGKGRSHGRLAGGESETESSQSGSSLAFPAAKEAISRGFGGMSGARSIDVLSGVPTALIGRCHSCTKDECFGDLSEFRISRQYQISRIPGAEYAWSEAHESALSEVLMDEHHLCKDAMTAIKEFIDVRGYLLCFRRPLCPIGTLCVHWYLSTFSQTLFYREEATDPSTREDSSSVDGSMVFSSTSGTTSFSTRSCISSTMASSLAGAGGGGSGSTDLIIRVDSTEKHPTSSTIKSNRYLDDCKRWTLPRRRIYDVKSEGHLSALEPLRVFVTGSIGCGKTSLIRRLIHDEFHSDPVPIMEGRPIPHLMWMGGLPFRLEFRELGPLQSSRLKEYDSRAIYVHCWSDYSEPTISKDMFGLSMDRKYDGKKDESSETEEASQSQAQASQSEHKKSGAGQRSFEEMRQIFYRCAQNTENSLMRRKSVWLVCLKGDLEGEFARGESELKTTTDRTCHWSSGTGHIERIGGVAWHDLYDELCVSWNLPLACVSAKDNKGIHYLFEMAVKEYWFKSQAR